MVTDHLTRLLECLHAAHVQTHGRIELERTSTGGRLRITKHHTNLLTQLVNEDHDTVRLADDRSELTQCL